MASAAFSNALASAELASYRHMKTFLEIKHYESDPND